MSFILAWILMLAGFFGMVYTINKMHADASADRDRAVELLASARKLNDEAGVFLEQQKKELAGAKECLANCDTLEQKYRELYKLPAGK